MTAFELHPQLAADTEVIGDLPLCRVLLMNDANYPWLILVPRRADTREVYELSIGQQGLLWGEVTEVGENMMQQFDGHKLNIAALGNMVPQLHIHVIVRYENDPAWPGPVWGAQAAQPYEAADLEERRKAITELFNLQTR
ncbi:MAG: HIT family protein [Salinisphaeraceae bacterium]|nr:HIT family protein [Salinisphaeraceae bacterium]